MSTQGEGLGLDAHPRVGLATAIGEWDHDEDGPILLDALGAAGITARPVVWTDPDAEWGSFDLVVVRSTWDYTDRLHDFLRWADVVAASTTLVNPPRVLRWNTDKRYLADLAEAGVRVVPTEFVAADSLPDTIEGRIDAWGDVVVKPTVSAGSRDTARHPAGEQRDALEHVRQLASTGRDVMVQPYLSAVDTAGETGMVFFDGEFSHGFRKGPMLSDGWAKVEGSFAPESIEAREPSAGELALAAQVLDAAGRRLGSVPVYARVDVIADDDGRPTLLELELTEPSFFLAHSDHGAERAAACIAEHARRAAART